MAICHEMKMGKLGIRKLESTATLSKSSFANKKSSKILKKLIQSFLALLVFFVAKKYQPHRCYCQMR